MRRESTVLLAILFLGCCWKIHSQRIYANAQQNSSTLLSSVSNAANAVDGNTGTHSTLNVGLTGIAQQNLQFTGVSPNPLPTSPIVLKLRISGSLAQLAAGITIQRTNAGIDNTVGTSYSGSTTLSLLGILGGGTIVEVVIPGESGGITHDGIRVRAGALLSLLYDVRLYHAFVITPPQTTSSFVYCENQSSLVLIENYQAGYTYVLFTEEQGGSQVASTTSQYLDVESLADGIYWLEARENDTDYPSARVSLQVTELPLPLSPTVTILNTND